MPLSAPWQSSSQPLLSSPPLRCHHVMETSAYRSWESGGILIYTLRSSTESLLHKILIFQDFDNADDADADDDDGGFSRHVCLLVVLVVLMIPLCFWTQQLNQCHQARVAEEQVTAEMKRWSRELDSRDNMLTRLMDADKARLESSERVEMARQRSLAELAKHNSALAMFSWAMLAAVTLLLAWGLNTRDASLRHVSSGINCQWDSSLMKQQLLELLALKQQQQQLSPAGATTAPSTAAGGGSPSAAVDRTKNATMPLVTPPSAEGIAKMEAATREESPSEDGAPAVLDDEGGLVTKDEPMQTAPSSS